jgi:hypothetical protein
MHATEIKFCLEWASHAWSNQNLLQKVKEGGKGKYIGVRDEIKLFRL